MSYKEGKEKTNAAKMNGNTKEEEKWHMYETWKNRRRTTEKQNKEMQVKIADTIEVHLRYKMPS